MRRLMACGFMGAYLLMLVFGLFSHAMGYKSTDHVGMYFLVWDMYCGWGGYEIRHHVIAEGESGQCYELTAPWGEFVPFGSADRHNYDASTSFTSVLAEHVLNHTDHEPIVEITLIEEAWSKKYNLPAAIYESRYEEPLEKRSYFRPRVVLSSEGEVRERGLDWTSWLGHQALADNPRLQRDIANRPFMMPEDYSTPEKVSRVNYSTTVDAPE